VLNYLLLTKSKGINIVRGEAQYVWDDSGKKYLDMNTCHGVAFLGHRNPTIVNALISQLSNIATLSTSFDTPVRDVMLEMLDHVKPKNSSHVFLLNSGSEAIEMCIKIARKATSRKKLIAIKNGFHGRTSGSLSLTWNPRYKIQFGELLTNVEHIDASQSSLSAIDEQTAAVFFEPVQGEGGVIPLEKEFVKALSEKCKEKGALLIADEVQSGFGRTGKVWAYEHFEVQPDVVVASKALGGGFPVSAVFAPEWVASKLEEGDHGSTFGGNPLACAAVAASCEVLIKDEVPAKASRMGELFKKRLNETIAQNRIVKSVRGLGLMIGVELRTNPAATLSDLQAQGVLALKAGLSVVRFLPPYMINEDDIEWAVNALARPLSKLAQTSCA
jgi:acetylornithine/LysW-gamma-L-lysine aminotransferase